MFSSSRTSRSVLGAVTEEASDEPGSFISCHHRCTSNSFIGWNYGALMPSRGLPTLETVFPGAHCGKYQVRVWQARADMLFNHFAYFSVCRAKKRVG